MWFEVISGLKINLSKSKLIPVRRVENLNKLAYEVSCKVGELPSTYLGLPLGAFHNYLATWDGMEEQFRKNWQCGKDSTFPRGGDSLSFGASYLVSLSTSCHYSRCRG